MELYGIWFGTSSAAISALVWHTSGDLDLLIIFSGAFAVALSILLVGALVGTLDICPVLGALIISNCLVDSSPRMIVDLTPALIPCR